MPPDGATLRTGSRAAAIREPCQVRKEAALSDHRRVPRNGLVRAAPGGGHGNAQIDSGCTATAPFLEVRSDSRHPGRGSGTVGPSYTSRVTLAPPPAPS